MTTSPRLRQLAREILTIVFSVSVALQFQDCHERSNNARIGHSAYVQIEEEIAFNRANVATSLEQLTEILETMEARQSDAKTLALESLFTLNLPAFFSGAYDSAVAAGAMRHIPAERAATIARVYKMQSWVALIQEHAVMIELDPVLALASDTQVNRYSQFMLELHTYTLMQRHFQGLLQFYDAFIADKATPALSPPPPT